MSRESDLATVLAGVHAFYRVDLTEFQLRAWLRMLDGFEVEQITKAFDLHMMDPSSGQFPPKPADIIKQLQGTQTDRAALAWSKVFEAIQRVGGYATVVFDEGAIHTAIEDLGGWPALCMSQTDELPFIERRFCNAYRAHLKAGSLYPAKLLGIHDRDNAIGGYKPQAPVLIGSPAACNQVLAMGNNTHRAQITQSIAVAALALTNDIERRQ